MAVLNEHEEAIGAVLNRLMTFNLTCAAFNRLDWRLERFLFGSRMIRDDG